MKCRAAGGFRVGLVYRAGLNTKKPAVLLQLAFDEWSQTINKLDLTELMFDPFYGDYSITIICLVAVC